LACGSWAAAKKSFAEHLRRSDYLSQEGVQPGIAFGKGAERLGIRGEMTAEQFLALADNKDPDIGQFLTVRDVANARPGYDFTFSGPKGFSSLWARPGDDPFTACLGSRVDVSRHGVTRRMNPPPQGCDARPAGDSGVSRGRMT
jgi:conjugative relaxase-like TrwC/TraI family protein